MLNQNPYEIEVIVKEVEVRGALEPRVYFRCKCGGTNLEFDENNPEPFYDFLKQKNVFPYPEEFPHRRKLIKFKVVVCKKCKAEIPHGFIGLEVERQLAALKSKKKK